MYIYIYVCIYRCIYVYIHVYADDDLGSASRETVQEFIIRLFSKIHRKSLFIEDRALSIEHRALLTECKAHVRALKVRLGSSQTNADSL